MTSAPVAGSIPVVASSEHTPVLTAQFPEQGSSFSVMENVLAHCSGSISSATETLVSNITDLTIKLVNIGARLSQDLDMDQVVSLTQLYESYQHRLNLLSTTLENLKKSDLAPSVFVPSRQDNTTITHSTVCPHNLPFFQWENDVFEKSSTVFIDVTACLQKFEDVMFSYRLNFNTNFLRLVPPMLSTSQRLWYDQFLSQYDMVRLPPTWSEFKTAITSRYGRTIDEDRADCAVQLVNIFMLKGESLDNFIERLNGLRRRTVDQTLPSSVLISKFLQAIPADLRDKVKVARVSMSEHEKFSIDAVMSITKSLYNDLYQAESSSASAVACVSGGTISGTSVASSGDLHLVTQLLHCPPHKGHYING
ncbi:hypothetical protein BD770DRAFT_449543 [Pilaira anomala]|nr:hypothetical protein BD770DRAFT_449543 [Pilaira anomala]